MTLQPGMDELPVEFHERLAQLLRAMEGAAVAAVRPADRCGYWVVELAFPDRAERATIIYAPDQIPA